MDPLVVKAMSTADQVVLRVAYHEAGHAVAAWEAGFVVKELEIQQGWFFSDVSGGFTRLGRFSLEEDQYLGYVTFLMAGTVAEERFLTEYGIPYSSSEVASHAEFDMMMFHDFTDEEDEWSESSVHGLAESLVDLCWPRIGALAAVLFEDRKMSGRAALRAGG